MIIKRLVMPALALAVTACATSPQGETPSASGGHNATPVENAQVAVTPAVRESRSDKNRPSAQGAPAARSVSGANNLVVLPGEKTDDAQSKSSAEAKGNEPRIIRGNDRVIAASKAAPAIEGGSNAFKFEDAPISEVVHVMMRDILKVDYVLHQPVAGSVTLATKSRVSADRALAMLEAALQANGLVMARDTRGVYHVGKPEALKGIGSATRQVGKDALPPGYGAIVVPLQFIGAAEMATILRPMMQADSLVRVDNLRNLLVLAGTRTQAEGWLDLVATFDVDLLKGMSVGVFPLKYASIKEVEAALSLMSGGGAPAAGAGAAPRTGATASTAPAAVGGSAATLPASLGEANPLFGALRVMPIERLNSILIVTPRAAYLDEARRWIERLDQPSDNSAEPQLFIYQVQNVNARHLASVLSGIFGGQTASPANTSTGVAPGLTGATGSSFGQGSSASPFGSSAAMGGSISNSGSSGLGIRTAGLQAGNANLQGARNTTQGGAAQTTTVANLGGIRVMADELNNSVLVWGTKGEYAKIEATLKRLDLPLTQVLIEATIVEVTLNDDLKYGLQWAFSDNRATTGYTGQGLISGDRVTNGVLGSSVTQGFTYTLSNPLGSVRAVLNALANKSLIKVISSPSLMVLDNHTATINVGDQQPIQTSVTSFVDNVNASTSTIQYKDTGVNLVVTPSVNSGNVVTMQVDQTVTDVGANQASAGGQPSFLQRQISSKVAVRSGETIVLGGLIKDNKTTGKSGVPYLQDVPIVGNLFGTNEVSGNRTELLVVITPRVVRSDVDIRGVSEDLRDRMKGLQRIEVLENGAKPQPSPSLQPPLQSTPSQ